MNPLFDTLTVPALTDQLRAEGYIADRGLATALLLSLKLGKPLLLEGEVGVGKTELAKTLATMLGRDLIRLQCYEGIDIHQAMYEWDYARQMLHIRALSATGTSGAEDDLFSPRFLLERPLLQALKAGDRCVLLIDEIDRADDEFEAFLLELLGDFQATIPEIGTVRADTRPIVILTSTAPASFTTPSSVVVSTPGLVSLSLSANLRSFKNDSLKSAQFSLLKLSQL